MIGEVNKNLKAKIVQNYGSQKQFAAENGLQEGMVSLVVRGRFNLDSDQQQRWASALRTSADELFSD
jgi:hypothetical protein